MKTHCIYGPPGTGKTTRLMDLLGGATRLYGGERVIFVSHTRAAAAEAMTRADGKISIPPENVSTLHSLCFRAMGYNRTQVVDRTRIRKFGELVGIPTTGKSDPDKDEVLSRGDFYLALYNLARVTYKDPAVVYDYSDRPGTWTEFGYFTTSYENWKHTYGLIDFTDMLSNFLEDQQVHEVEPEVLIVDEAQDLSPLQWDVVMYIARTCKYVHVAGDDDQAIFTWGGADEHGIDKFEKLTGAKRDILSQSYRIPGAVYKISQALIRRCKSRVDKNYAPRADEGVVREFSSIEHLPPEDESAALFLYRDFVVRKDIEDYLISNYIPYHCRTGYASPLQSNLCRAIGSLERAKALGGRVPTSEEHLVRRFLSGYGRHIADNDGMDRVVQHGWEQMLKVPSRLISYHRQVLHDAEPRFTLSTIHGAKGRESRRVVVCTGMSNKIAEAYTRYPDPEHRVFYVAATRAIEQLDIVGWGSDYPLR